MLLIIGALALLGTLSLAINSTILNKYTLIYEAEATIDAISVGQAMLDEALAKEFDEKTIGEKVYSDTALTLPANFGFPKEGDTKIDDFDDYHNYSRTDSTPRMGKFLVNTRVFYVQNG
ncbi:MAG: hypothetical protein ABIK27_05245, partial [Bacteroidota bacterium]